MNKFLAGLALVALWLLLGAPVVVCADTPAEDISKTVARLDAEFFDAYNRCDLEKLAGFMDEHVEFYHDKGGVTWTRQDVVDAVKRNICGKCVGIAKTAMLWRLKDGNWQMTRIFSYDHQPLNGDSEH